MRKRNYRVEIYFNKDELETLTKKYKKTGLSRETYCRQALLNSFVKQAPSADIPLLLREVNRVGISIDRILKKANGLGFVDKPLLISELKKIEKIENVICDAFTIDNQ